MASFGPRPLLGQDTDDVLRELGLPDQEVRDLAAQGVIRQTAKDGL